MLRKTNSVPLHTQASNYMREKIYNREWDVDEKIPTEFELTDTTAVEFLLLFVFGSEIVNKTDNRCE